MARSRRRLRRRPNLATRRGRGSRSRRPKRPGHGGLGSKIDSRSRKDVYGKKASKEGYPARSVYKLEEIQRRARILRKGDRVLDLGAAPGSWTLYTAKEIAPNGKVIGYDLKECTIALPKNAELRVGDVTELDESELGRFDVVLSDMAPNTSGKRDLDMYRSYELYVTALEIAERLLKPGGNFVGKIFQGAEFEEARAKTRALFEKVRIIKPKAVRSESYELFLVGLKRREIVAPPSGEEE